MKAEDSVRLIEMDWDADYGKTEFWEWEGNMSIFRGGKSMVEELEVFCKEEKYSDVLV